MCFCWSSSGYIFLSFLLLFLFRFLCWLLESVLGSCPVFHWIVSRGCLLLICPRHQVILRYMGICCLWCCYYPHVFKIFCFSEQPISLYKFSCKTVVMTSWNILSCCPVFSVRGRLKLFLSSLFSFGLLFLLLLRLQCRLSIAVLAFVFECSCDSNWWFLFYVVCDPLSDDELANFVKKYLQDDRFYSVIFLKV